MRRLRDTCVGFLLLTASSLAQAAPPEGFDELFNGRNFKGWTAIPRLDPAKLAAMSDAQREQSLSDWMNDAQTHWTVDNGELVNDGKGPYLTTEESFGDIELRLEYKTVPLADSGIYLRGSPQVQIWDYTEAGGKWSRGAKFGSGGLFNNAADAPGRNPSVLADRPFGEWNQFRIIQVGSRTTVWLNGRKVVRHALMENHWNRKRPLNATGPIQLQTHGGEIRWRNIHVRRIPSEEANRILKSESGPGFTSIFNGRSFDGWAGAVDNYTIEDGSIVCKPGKGGVLFTKKSYGDFKVRLEFQLPPHGNNGLAIRYPGQGRPSVDGMTEIQILDSEHPKYARLDARQYHGSAYGMVPAHRGFLRPNGEWNFQEVTVQGSQITVELNGVPILKADLNTVTEFKGDETHPGKDRTEGHFGFAGHNDPVPFRNIEIRELTAH